MSIHFTCLKCGKALVAQDQFAGQPVTCPVCQTATVIPGVPAAPAAPVATRVPGDPMLLDMEKGPISVVSAETAVTVNRQDAPAESLKDWEKLLHTSAGQKSVTGSERFRGDDSSSELALAAARGSLKIWRTLSVFTTACTTTWLMLLTLNDTPNTPWTLLVFNAIMISGLIWNAGQMRKGPVQVFITSAVAIIICTPFNVILDLPLDFTKMVEVFRQQNPQMSNIPDEEVIIAFKWLFALVSTGIGGLFSIPLWVAVLKLKKYKQMRKARG